MEKKATRKKASHEEMIERLKNQNAKYELMIARNNDKIKKLESSIRPAELLEKIQNAGLSIQDVIKMIDEKNKI